MFLTEEERLWKSERMKKIESGERDIYF